MQEKRPSVLTKIDFVERYLKGEFGNCSPSWDTYAEFRDLNRTPLGRFHLRNRVVGGPTYYDLTAVQAENLWERVANPESYYLSAMCPTEKTTIQGEVYRSPEGLCLFASTVRKPMRQSLIEGGEHYYRSAASAILHGFLCPRSYDWMTELLDTYEDHVVEFTALEEPWGSLYPLYNTLYWEVRRY